MRVRGIGSAMVVAAVLAGLTACDGEVEGPGDGGGPAIRVPTAPAGGGESPGAGTEPGASTAPAPGGTAPASSTSGHLLIVGDPRIPDAVAGEVSVVLVGDPVEISGSHSVAVIVRNGTNAPVYDVTLDASVVSGGQEVASGGTLGSYPHEVLPGESTCASIRPRPPDPRSSGP